MRIGIDVRLVHYRKAGISWYTLRLLQALAQIDHENEYVLLQHRKQVEALLTAPNFSVATLMTPPHFRFEQWPLSLETLFLDLDLIHSPDFIPPLHNRIPAVITVHDLGFLLYPNFVTADAARYYGQTELAVKRASRIIAVSNSTRTDLVKLLGTPESKISVIYEAADPLFKPISVKEARQCLREAQISIPEQFILAVGTIEPRKNLGTLLRAYLRLRADYGLKLPLVLAGEPGWLFDDIQTFVQQQQLEKDVFIIGRIAGNEELRALYNLATMLVHPAFYEGFGLPPLESMACGTPVVCSNAGSLPEVVGDAALMAPPEDVERWTLAILRMAQDADLREEFRQKGLERARQFSWEKAAEQTLQVYQQAVERY
ncbi:MAG: glycosyltransferase family 4 protein [Chloroflexi bacterium]|nr:glycosyltransferase family 4 protein [Chloroflexota bacterium]